MSTEQINKPLVAVVTGASRGAGKGIAIALGKKGYTVYVTGRSQEQGREGLPGTIHQTAAEVSEAGGLGIAVACDHGEDQQVQALFDQVRAEQGRLHLLVNNACAIPAELTEVGPFWQKPLSLTRLFDVGMRSAYVASYYAAPLLTETGFGLVANTSSFGGRCYMHGPAYGAGKAAVDKMAADMAVDFKPFGIAAVSIWMGLLRTERTQQVFDAEPEKYAQLAATSESPQLTGMVLDALLNDPLRMEKSGQILVGAELAQQFGIVDIDGKQPPSHAPMLGEPAQVNPAIVE